jgi:branched-chain amino acid aminotransferase
MTEQLCWLNGELLRVSQARISPLDRGLLYGDGLFETMRAYGGVIFRLGAHVERLLQAAKALRFPFALDAEMLAEACQEVVGANDLTDAYVRLTITRGVGGLPGELDASREPTILAVAREYHGYPPELCERGMNAAVASVRRNASSVLSRVKSLNYLDNVLARAQAAERGADEALLLDSESKVVEGSASNVFILPRVGRASSPTLTPPVSAGVLAGITRECILELCAELDIDSAEESFTLDELLAAEEAFLTNSLMEVVPLTRVDGIPVGRGIPGRVTKSLMQAYRELVREETASSRMRDSHLFPPDDGAANGRRAGGGNR